jgi:hypothetical protein
MTLCMAITDGTNTWIGADTNQGSEGFRFAVNVQKWQEVGGWWIGIAGGAAFKDTLASLNVRAGISPRDLADAMFARHIERGFKPSAPENSFPEFDSNFIFARPGEIYHVGDQGTITQIETDHWHAIGCGDELALGVLNAISADGKYPEMAMRKAIDIAGKHRRVILGCWTKSLEPQTSGFHPDPLPGVLPQADMSKCPPMPDGAKLPRDLGQPS